MLNSYVKSLYNAVYYRCMCLRAVCTGLILTCLFAVIVKPAWAEEQVLTVLVPSNIREDFFAFVGGRSIVSIDRYEGEHSRREVAELVLLCQALYLGGYQGDITYVIQTADYLRNLKLLADAEAVIYGSAVWRENILGKEEYFWMSDALVKDGEFVVGLYTAADNHRALAVKTLGQLTHLSAVSNRHWESDWRNLERLHLKKMYSVRKWDSMVKMVHARRADFTLAPFQSTPNRILLDGDVRLVPIPNVSLILDGSRHWVVSKKHVMGEKVYKILTKGMASLRNQGTIERAYRESGFFQEKNDYWPVLNRVTYLKAKPVLASE